MSKTKNLGELVNDLQSRNEQLEKLYSLFNKACKSEFGYNIDELHKLIEKCDRLEKMRAETSAGKQGQQSH